MLRIRDENIPPCQMPAANLPNLQFCTFFFLIHLSAVSHFLQHLAYMISEFQGQSATAEVIRMDPYVVQIISIQKSSQVWKPWVPGLSGINQKAIIQIWISWENRKKKGKKDLGCYYLLNTFYLFCSQWRCFHLPNCLHKLATSPVKLSLTRINENIIQSMGVHQTERTNKLA